MRYTVDTNILSEPTKKHPNEGVMDWLRQNGRSFYIPSICITEMRYGFERMQDCSRKEAIGSYIDRICSDWSSIIVPLDIEIANTVGRLEALSKREGKVLEVEDYIVLATALFTETTLVTGNIGHFELLKGIPELAGQIKLANPYCGK